MWEVDIAFIEEWLDGLSDADAIQVFAAIDILREAGPALQRPLVGKIVGSRYAAMKELRPGSSGGSEIRILFIFDPQRKAVLLLAGDKQGRWDKWYRQMIPIAERRYAFYLKGLRG